MGAASELALLVEAEARLDRELADAREQATAIERAARARVEAAAAALADQLATERARVSAAVDADTTARLAAIEEEARDLMARFDAVSGSRAIEIATTVVDTIGARIRREASP